MIKKVTSLFTKYVMEEKSARFVAISMIILTLLNKLFGMGSRLVIAYFYGADRATDIFIAASSIPEFLASILFIGITNAAVIPTLVTCLKSESRKDFWKHVNNMMGVISLGYAIFAFILILLARPLMRFYIINISNQYVLDPFTHEEIDRIIQIMIILFIPQMLTGLSIFITSVLHTFNRFVIAQFAPLGYNIGNIIGLILYLRFRQDDPHALAFGMIIGALFHIGVQLPALIRTGYTWNLLLDFKDHYLRMLFRRGGLRAIGISIDQVYILLSRFVSISLRTGSLSAFTFALSVASIPFSIFGVTLSSIVFPSLNRKFIDGDKSGFDRLFTRTMDKILFLSVPVCVLLIILRLPVVRLAFGLFEQTSFTWEDTLLTAWVLFFLVLGIIPEVLKVLFVRVLFAREEIKKTVIIGGISVLIDIIGLLFITNYFSNIPHLSLQQLVLNTSQYVNSYDFHLFTTRGVYIAAVGGVALASSLTATIVMTIYAVYIHVKVISFTEQRIWLPMLKKFIAAAIMAITTYWGYKLWGELLNTQKTIQTLILTFFTSGIGIVTYVWFEYLLKDRVLFRIIPKWMR